jgi:hypothetical protein
MWRSGSASHRREFARTMGAGAVAFLVAGVLGDSVWAAVARAAGRDRIRPLVSCPNSCQMYSCLCQKCQCQYTTTCAGTAGGFCLSLCSDCRCNNGETTCFNGSCGC